MNKVQHFEIPADDTSRARKFYESTFGWQTNEWPMPDGTKYIGLNTGPVDENNMWKEPGFINGGMFERNKSFPVNAPTVAVVVEDIDSALEKAQASGGAVVMEKREIAGMGLYAYIKDTENNVVGVWQDIKKE